MKVARHTTCVDIDDEVKHFTMDVMTGLGVHPHDREYSVLSWHRLELRGIVQVVLRFHAGEQLDFPIDLFEMP